MRATTPVRTSKKAKSPEAKVRLEKLAYQLAEHHAAASNGKPKARLLEHLQDWEKTLQDAYQRFRSAPSKSLPYSRASEWMLDNFYVVQQTLHQIEEDLPRHYLGELPALNGTALQGYPRVFALAWEWVRFCGGQLDLVQIVAFVQYYQEITPLGIGELWALPTMLRIAVLESLAAAVAKVSRGKAAKGLEKRPILPTPPSLSNETIVANCFLSLRLLAVTDWKSFFEETSRVERILRDDPAGVYVNMDFETRNMYRSVVEELARHSKHNEEEVAQAAVDFAAHHPGAAADNAAKDGQRNNHVGFYLIDQGRPQFEKQIAYRPPLSHRPQRWLLAHPTPAYLGSIALLTLLIAAGLMYYAFATGASTLGLLLTGLLGVCLAMEVAIGLVNWAVTHQVPPHALPRMDFSESIPATYRTMVVIPALLTNPNELGPLLQELELHFLCNPDPLLTFALLTDFADAPAQHMPEDEELLSRARAGIEGLNRKYARYRNTQRAPFYVFHRERRWNASQGAWMGWERKRGKLAEFNRLVLDGRETSHILQVGDLSVLRQIKYVITLDADTSLPQGSASRLVATLAHPLNRAAFSSDGRSVTAGYTILQPRVEIKPTSANRSIFSQIYSGNTGFDLYTLAVSDVYQDLFGEGSYVGKGIYDVAAFEKSLAGQVRENTLLSHDLFEGILGRAALVTDVILYEDYPTRYMTYARRLERWIRGDWQLLPWLLGLARAEKGTAPKPLSTINRWKVLDNLRRSLLAPTLLLTLAAGWLHLPGSPLLWTAVALLTPALPAGLQLVEQGKQKLDGISFKEMLEPVFVPLARWAFAVLFLPYETFLALGAITITLLRLLVTRRHMLEWTTSAHTARLFRSHGNVEIWWEMSPSLVFAALLGVLTAWFNPPALAIALPLLLAWIVSPQIAYRISKPVVRPPAGAPLSTKEKKELERLARRTWAFFEQFAGPDDHWLPPDHFQESPRGNVAHYTTPTNIGVFLVSTLAAYDLGYIGLLELAVRLRSSFENMEMLEHYRGHLLNWYDTQAMTPLAPRYVSTVDSGNLAACLITLRQGCLALKDSPVVGEQQWRGLLVIVDILADTLSRLAGNDPHSPFEPFENDLQLISERILATKDHPETWVTSLIWLSTEGWENISQQLMQVLETNPANIEPEALNELHLYLDSMHHHLQSLQQNIGFLAPWLNHIYQPPAIFDKTASLAEPLKKFRENLPAKLPNLGNTAQVYAQTKTSLAELQAHLDGLQVPAQELQEATKWFRALHEELDSARLRAETLLIGYRDLAAQAIAYVNAMDFKFLYGEERQVFHIGYNVTTERLDANHYDLLASEARIASLIAIAKGDVPQSHWLHLSRPITKVDGKRVLLSWSGTMFEYLMPVLFTRMYEGTFLAESCHAAVDAQISYAREHRVPWGTSESGYFAFDANLNYQYRAFGIPELGYKRDLLDDLVITPYATALALALRPKEAMENLAYLQKLQMLGRFGLYEAIDYTRKRLPVGQPFAIVKSYMAHHQGMILMAACNTLVNDAMLRRFHADEHIQSIDLLIQEKIPQTSNFEYPHPDEPLEVLPYRHAVHIVPWRVPVDTPVPLVNFLSQGSFGSLITNAGGGYSQWQDIALTRWQADSTLDQFGTWIYVQDRDNGALWSATSQPVGSAPASQEILYSPHKVDFRRWDHGVSLHTEITVSADGVEVRRVTLLNDGDHPRRLKLSSYAEVALAEQAVDQRHPAFNKLFIESEYLSDGNALLFVRRPRSADEKPLVLVHALVADPGRRLTAQYETDRARFLGRGRSCESPAVLEDRNRPLAGATGGTLDPIFSLSQEIDLKPHSKTSVTFLTMAAPSRAEALELVSRYQSGLAITRAFDDARVQSERELAELGLDGPAVEHIQRLLSVLLYPASMLRAAPHILAKNEKGQPGLWAYGISGDYPILLVRIHKADSPLLLEALQAYIYWHNRQLKINLVILNEQDTGYSLDLHNQIYRQIVHMGAEAWLRQRDGIFLLRTDQIPKSDRILLETAAGAILNDKKGTLLEHTNRLTSQSIRLPAFTPALAAQDPEPTAPLQLPDGLLMENGLGGFSPDGREYVIHLQAGQNTPHPWTNVIANPHFGFLVSEAGSACTWAENSGENRLTPWGNDPLTDMPGEALYLRDEETGLVWSPTPMPAGSGTGYLIRHGAGYSTFESQSHGLNQRLRLFAAPDTPVKIAHLRLENLWTRPRRLTVTYYAEWVLGSRRDLNQAYIVPEFEPGKHALLATNRYNTEFGQRVAFLAANKKPHGVTADRAEFLGRQGSLRMPAALRRIGLAGTVRAGLDPCAALQLHVDLAPGQVEEVFFLIGQGANRAESLSLISAYQAREQIEAAWQSARQRWDELLDSVEVQTPDVGMNLLLNRWLLYQTLACRLWGRTALYQSSGAFGFRDQLQDVMALLHTRPALAREHILDAAARQFEAGDVLHWWHPPSGRGVRTRFSDDLLWLPYVTAEYVTATGDLSILDEKIAFLRGEPLQPDEVERYGQYESTPETYPLYEHCKRAMAKGMTAGVHGIPLMGSGDWNDGMNHVGIKGRGESIWLGWFLHATLTRFVRLCDAMREDPQPYLRHAEELARAIETHAWDGEWYLRAFYDDGSSLGSSANRECRIDAIAQSWAVLSGAGQPARATQAMESVERMLVREPDQLIMLFTPPFDNTTRDPGYIKGYYPGIRENGGQYTHAAVWTVWAFAALGQGDRAEALFHLLNPIYHTDTPEKVALYKVEPYSVAADIYSVQPHTGNGGWTWYTGSSGWMYRLGIEALLGLSRAGNVLKIHPCIPKHWPGFKVDYRFGATHYLIEVENPHGVNQGVEKTVLNGMLLPDNQIPLSDDHKTHQVQVVMGLALPQTSAQDSQPQNNSRDG